MLYIIYTSSVHAMHYYIIIIIIIINAIIIIIYHHTPPRHHHNHFITIICITWTVTSYQSSSLSSAYIHVHTSGDSHSSVADSFYSIAGVHRSQGMMSSFGCRIAHLGANYTDDDRLDNDCWNHYYKHCNINIYNVFSYGIATHTVLMIMMILTASL